MGNVKHGLALVKRKVKCGSSISSGRGRAADGCTMHIKGGWGNYECKCSPLNQDMDS